MVYFIYRQQKVDGDPDWTLCSNSPVKNKAELFNQVKEFQETKWADGLERKYGYVKSPSRYIFVSALPFSTDQVTEIILI